ncbi:helix-turn-helix domain-containing protein [Bremerella alba]|uniref:Helix-turn-helix domain-containing protein n=1 Tax=Bremerella alba TaxID=980252 RepID=A0A7V8V8F1_9BACT|nr:helix-turn-helix domain-containing protein [Bremerella alba]MBA2116833.1 hypothetical protein [Bremerella alba]
MTHPNLAATDQRAAESPVSPVQPLLVNKATAADILQVTEKTLDKWIIEFGLPCVRLGRSIRFSIEALKAWIVERGSN